MTEQELTPKEVGGFRILRRLASGATSDVLLARAEGPHGFQRVVALKILLPGTQGDAEFERKFAAAASAYARLSNPAVVKLYDFFSADGQLVLVLEYVDGVPLHKLRAMLASTGERLDDKAVLFLGLRLFTAVAAAHGARDPARGEFAPIVHYDINPSNVLVPWDGQVKVGDFGIAKAAGIETDAGAGFIKGTYGYASPEQALGKEATPRADIYSAALILWELLAHRKAVQRGTLNDAQVHKAMAHPEYPALDVLRPELSGPLRTAVRRALEPDPEKRSITAEEMVAILRQTVNADDGRKALADAVTRVRSAGPGDPLATTAQYAVDSGRDAMISAGDRVDPDQTAPVSAINPDSPDLGKIAFYGRINLPPASDPGSLAPPTPAGGPPASARPPPLPATIPLLPGGLLEGLAQAAAGQVDSVDMARPAPVALPGRAATPWPGGQRAVPRPVIERKPTGLSGFPTARPPAVPGVPEGVTARPPAPDAATEGQTPIGSAAVKEMARPATLLQFGPPPGAGLVSPPAIPAVEAPPAIPPATPRATTPPAKPPPIPEIPAAIASVAATESPAAHVPEAEPSKPVVAPSAMPAPPTERSPEATQEPSDVGRPAAGAVPVTASGRPNAPPYVLSSLPPPAKKSNVVWVVGALVLIIVVAGGAAITMSGDSGSTVASTTKTAPTVATAIASTPAATTASTPAANVDPQAAAPVPSPSSASAGATSASAAASAFSSASASSGASSGSASSFSSSGTVVAAVTPSAPSATRAVTAPPASPPPAAPSGADSADSGDINPPASAAGHRVFVDGKVAGEGTAPIHVHCGNHLVKVGSAGAEKTVKVPCGGSISL